MLLLCNEIRCHIIHKCINFLKHKATCLHHDIKMLLKSYHSVEHTFFFFCLENERCRSERSKKHLPALTCFFIRRLLSRLLSFLTFIIVINFEFIELT